MQVPSERVRDHVLDQLQKTINGLVFGRFYSVAVPTAQQPPCDGGFGHINLARRMEAEWATLACRLCDDKPAPWKNIWWRHLRDVYGTLADRDMLLGSWSYALLR